MDETSGPVQARLEQSRTGKLSRVRPGQSKPPDLKRSKPLQARLEQTRTGKLRSGQASPNHLTSNDLSPLEACSPVHVKITKAVLFWKANLKTMEKKKIQLRNSGNGASDQLMSGLCPWDMKDGIVPLDEPGDLTLKKELYVMCPEYAEYALKKFSSWVSSLWKSIKKNVSRAEEDKAAMLNGKAPNPSDCYETT
eukprot:jgi/Psemu1/40156/gm1.40156_g